jgi:hypothetical protein
MIDLINIEFHRSGYGMLPDSRDKDPGAPVCFPRTAGGGFSPDTAVAGRAGRPMRASTSPGWCNSPPRSRSATAAATGESPMSRASGTDLRSS